MEHASYISPRHFKQKNILSTRSDTTNFRTAAFVQMTRKIDRIKNLVLHSHKNKLHFVRSQSSFGQISVTQIAKRERARVRSSVRIIILLKVFFINVLSGSCSTVVSVNASHFTSMFVCSSN